MTPAEESAQATTPIAARSIPEGLDVKSGEPLPDRKVSDGPGPSPLHGAQPVTLERAGDEA